MASPFRPFGVAIALVLTWVGACPAATTQQQAAARETGGDLAGAKALLEQTAASGHDPAASEALAIFLYRHGDPGLHDALLKWAQQDTDAAQRQFALREAVLTDFMSNRPALAADLQSYRQAGGHDLSLPKSQEDGYSRIQLPGPLTSFARMAALAPDLDPEDLLPALARNVVTNGYQAASSEQLQQTEFLKLLTRYLSQAHELQSLANAEHDLVITACDSEQTGNLLKVLGYRMRGSCGSDIALETVNPTRAFVTIDSGFPLSELERDLRGNHPFRYQYGTTSIPVLLNGAFWMRVANKADPSDFIGTFVSDPGLCRMYLGLSHVDRATAQALVREIPVDRLRVEGSVLDFYGGMFQTRDGSAVVPGSPKLWASLVGVSPSKPGAFFERLMTTDDGWLAGYFDALMRLDDGPTRRYLTQPDHLRRYYEALRGKVTSPGPARPVFRATTDLLLLTTSLRVEPDGSVHVPGNLDVWRTLFIRHPHAKYDGKLTRAAASWRTKDDLVEALFGLSRKTADNEPLKIFLSLNDVDRNRATPLSANLASRLIASYRAYGAQYRLFTDAPSLSETTIAHFLDFCAETGNIRDTLLRSDVTGSAQALIEIWSILVRQNSIDAAHAGATLDGVLRAFDGVHERGELFAASKTSIDDLLAAAGVQNEPGSRHDRLVELLVGHIRRAPEGWMSPAERFARVYDAQNLLEADTLIDINDHLGKGQPDSKDVKAIAECVERLREADSLHDSLSADEKGSVTGVYWSAHHIAVEKKLDLNAVLKAPDKKDGRAALEGLLRDSLVGIIYCYYAPPGAQILNTNSLFVRSHDFVGLTNTASYWEPTETAGIGWPSSEGGQLRGSLATLPYALAEAEQNFLSPRHQQALIWGDLVPQIVIGVTIPRLRNVAPLQIRWIALHMDRGRSLLAAAALNADTKVAVMDALQRYLSPMEVDRVRAHLDQGDYARATVKIPPSVLYAISFDKSLNSVPPDLSSKAIAELADSGNAELSESAIAHSFGTPKPTLLHSYSPALTYTRTFPALMGYSSRILAETWESNNLYYAALADEVGVPASDLDMYAPEWNRADIENIFAANLEDWPALIRSLNHTAEAVLHGPGDSSQQTASNDFGK